MLYRTVNRRAGLCVPFEESAVAWSGARVVEEAALEMLYTGNRIEGSNPSRSVYIALTLRSC